MPETLKRAVALRSAGNDRRDFFCATIMSEYVYFAVKSCCLAGAGYAYIQTALKPVDKRR